MSVQHGPILLHFLGVSRNGWANGGPSELTESDWAQILRLAGENGVTPLLYHRLMTTVPVPPVPPLALVTRFWSPRTFDR